MSEKIERATAFRDGMIGVARALADRSCGATQREMREAQIEWVAQQLADTEPASAAANKAGGLWYKRWHKQNLLLQNLMPSAETKDAKARLSEIIKTRILGVQPDDQDVVLEDSDWLIILAALLPGGGGDHE